MAIIVRSRDYIKWRQMVSETLSVFPLNAMSVSSLHTSKQIFFSR